MTKKEILLRQEELLEFPSFDEEDALLLGNLIVKRAKEARYKIAVLIRLNDGLTLFQCTTKGASLLNQIWAEKKFNTTRIMRKSSFLAVLEAEEIGQTMADHGLQESCAYAPGAFPVRVKGAGIIGAVAISGIMDLREHDFVPECMAEYLKISDFPLVMEKEYIL
ncbi:MAG: hypothetical protein HFI64_10045 [Lachnospiraceae bacterium]|nr:hypothetical protein [Lachnospiraceae bacterium]